MKNDRRQYLARIFLCTAIFQTAVSAQTTAAAETASAVAAAAPVRPLVVEENLIHSGDLIDIDVIGSTEYDWRGTLTPEGFLSGVHFTENPIYALCRTEDAVAEDIAKAYSRILRAPQVSVKILDRSGRAAAVLFGAVRNPILLNELIILGGGFTDKASGEIQIFRPQNLNCLNEAALPPNVESKVKSDGDKSADAQYINIKIGDLLAGRANPQILSGDVVTVLEAKPIYVIGAVGVPKQISTRTETTLSRAVDGAGGLLKNADASAVTIFRRAAAGGETKIIEVDLNKIKAGQAEDIVLQAFDVVEVGQTGREKRKFPPVLKIDDAGAKSAQNLPLRIVE